MIIPIIEDWDKTSINNGMFSHMI